MPRSAGETETRLQPWGVCRGAGSCVACPFPHLGEQVNRRGGVDGEERQKARLLPRAPGCIRVAGREARDLLA